MNILIITRLYPVTTKHYSFEKVNDVIHSFAKEWSKTDSIYVVRPLVTNINPLKPHKYDRNKIKPGNVVLEGISLSKIKIIRIPFFEIYFKTKRIIKNLKNNNFKPDVIVSHLNESIMISSKISRYYKIPLIAGIHMSDLEFLKIPVAGRRLAYALKYAAGIACRSHAIQKRFLRSYPDYQDKCFIAASGIDPAIIINSTQLQNKIDNFNCNPLKIITVSYLEKRKKIDNILKTLSSLKDTVNFEYTIIGDGEERQYLEQLTDELQIRNKVKFEGYKPKPETISNIEKSDVMILVSDRETFGIVYLEAMAKGLITVATRDWGVDGVITDGENGFLSNVDDNSELKNIIIKIKNMSKSEISNILKSSHMTICDYTTSEISQKYLNNIKVKL